jgi:hypothetical protein
MPRPVLYRLVACRGSIRLCVPDRGASHGSAAPPSPLTSGGHRGAVPLPSCDCADAQQQLTPSAGLSWSSSGTCCLIPALAFATPARASTPSVSALSAAGATTSGSWKPSATRSSSSARPDPSSPCLTRLADAAQQARGRRRARAGQSPARWGGTVRPMTPGPARNGCAGGRQLAAAPVTEELSLRRLRPTCETDPPDAAFHDVRCGRRTCRPAARRPAGRRTGRSR